MTLLVTAAAGAGLWLLVAGIPVWRRRSLADRVEPYLSGLHGRPSELVSGRVILKPGVVRTVAARLAGVAPAPGDLARRLEAAGDPRTPEQFRVEQTIWALAGLVASLALVAGAATAGVSVEPASVPALALIAGVGGWLGRDWWLTKETARRRSEIRTALPPAIDLLVLSLTAGESVGAAFDRVAGLLHGALADELRMVLGDVRTGSTVVEALEELDARVGDPAVGRLVDALCTGIEKGAPLAEVLRAQADDGRDLARRRLLEMGGRREVWMLVPVVFLVMPVVVVWALFPGLVSLDLLVP